LISLSYGLLEGWDVEQVGVDIAEASKDQLDYWFFPGNVTFVADGLEFVADGIPVMEFAEGLFDAVENLVKDREYTYGFTEGEGIISFERDVTSVRISSKFGGTDRGTAQVSFEEFREAANRFFQTGSFRPS
jgi:hypothetical protein